MKRNHPNDETRLKVVEQLPGGRPLFSLELSQLPPLQLLTRVPKTNRFVGDHLRRWSEARPFVAKRIRVGVFGEFDAGKSTLVNSLLGREVLSTSVVPETATIQIATCDGPVERPHPQGAEAFLQPRDSIFRYGLELWDTPGSNAESATHESTADSALTQVDLILVLIRAVDGVTRTSKALVERARLFGGQNTRIRVLLSHYDELLRSCLGEDEAEEVVAETARGLELSHQPLRINATDTTQFDGPLLVQWLRRITLAHVLEVLPGEIAQPEHWIRLAIAHGVDWTHLVPAELRTERIAAITASASRSHVEAMRTWRKGRGAAYTGYISRNLAEMRRSSHKEWASAMSWWKRLLRYEIDWLETIGNAWLPWATPAGKTGRTRGAD